MLGLSVGSFFLFCCLFFWTILCFPHSTLLPHHLSIHALAFIYHPASQPPLQAHPRQQGDCSNLHIYSVLLNDSKQPANHGMHEPIPDLGLGLNYNIANMEPPLGLSMPPFEESEVVPSTLPVDLDMDVPVASAPAMGEDDRQDNVHRMDASAGISWE
jgi:hypothetical protein